MFSFFSFFNLFVPKSYVLTEVEAQSLSDILEAVVEARAVDYAELDEVLMIQSKLPSPTRLTSRVELPDNVVELFPHINRDDDPTNFAA